MYLYVRSINFNSFYDFKFDFRTVPTVCFCFSFCFYFQDLAESCPKFIATQAPLHSTLFDFWLMVYEQGSEVIVMLSSEIESQDTKVSINRGQRSLPCQVSEQNVQIEVGKYVIICCNSPFLFKRTKINQQYKYISILSFSCIAELNGYKYVNLSVVDCGFNPRSFKQ